MIQDKLEALSIIDAYLRHYEYCPIGI